MPASRKPDLIPVDAIPNSSAAPERPSWTMSIDTEVEVKNAPGAPALASRVRELLAAAGLPNAEVPERGLDHGASGATGLAAVHLAKLLGATVIATSSSDEKLERLRALGADHLINYRSNPQWGETARTLNGGRGVDQPLAVEEIGDLGRALVEDAGAGRLATGAVSAAVA